MTPASPGMIETRTGFWDTIRSGLSTSVEGLLWSLQLVIIGLFLVAPWALVLWVGWRVIRRARGREGGAGDAGESAGAAASSGVGGGCVLRNGEARSRKRRGSQPHVTISYGTSGNVLLKTRAAA